MQKPRFNPKDKTLDQIMRHTLTVLQYGRYLAVQQKAAHNG